MIISEKQLGASRRVRNRLEQQLDTLRSAGAGQESSLDADIEVLESKIAEMQADIEEYLKFRNGEVAVAKYASFADMPKALVQARILAGMSQTELGKALGVKPQQIQRYETTRYMGASLARLIEVARALDLRVVSECKRGRKRKDMAKKRRK